MSDLTKSYRVPTSRPFEGLIEEYRACLAESAQKWAFTTKMRAHGDAGLGVTKAPWLWEHEMFGKPLPAGMCSECLCRECVCGGHQ